MIVIIGGGPVGLFTAANLVDRFPVTVYEEHPRIGSPVQCTGIVTSEIKNIVKLKKEIVLNTITSAEINSPDNTSISLPVKDYVIDREKFDLSIMEMAKQKGAIIKTNARFVNYNQKTRRVYIRGIRSRKRDGWQIKAEYLVGADGPKSRIAEILGNCKIEYIREYIIGKQARVVGKFEKEKFSVFLGNKIAPGFFAWIVPENEEVARVGIGVKGTVYMANKMFEMFLRRFYYKKVLNYQAGLIPLYPVHKQNINSNRIYLVGDAACHVKATTGGGLVPGLMAAKILAKCIKEGKDYNKSLLSLRKNLWLHAKIREILNRLNDEEINTLIKMLNNEKAKKVFKDENRDRPIRLATKVLLAKPRLTLFALRTMFK
ncbi:MAG: NAD(P)/FAD-dependent oxidoreductase [Candidatus Woesearchaeota archaeon]